MTSFSTLGLKPELVQAVEALGFTQPTPIQQQAIPALLSDDLDLIALAQTGTGKTAAFGLPLLHRTNVQTTDLQAIILCPTRELCLQIGEDFKEFGKFLPHLKTVAVYGGSNIVAQIKDIQRGAQIIVGTPGRFIDLMERGVINMSLINTVVLDEADEMLNMGFMDDVNEILSRTPQNRHVWLFSATMPAEVRNITRRFMNQPFEVTVGSKNQMAENIAHHYYVVRSAEKYSALKRIVDFHPEIYGLIFCRTKLETQEVAEKLIRDGYNADSLHGDLSQQQRDKVMNRFRERSLQILVATDVAARGIDVDDISHVIHYSLPDETAVYTHRSGRTARAGKTGVSIAMITPKESGRIKDLERLTKAKFIPSLVPTGFQVCERQLMHFIAQAVNVEVNEVEMKPYLESIYEQLESFSKEEIIRRFASLEFNRFLTYYRHAPNLNYSTDKKPKTFQRFFINLGGKDGYDKKRFFRFLLDATGLEASEVGRIEMKDSFSFFETDKSETERIKSVFANYELDGRAIRIEESERPPFEKGSYEGGRTERSSYGDRKSSGGYNDRKSSSYGDRKSGGSSYGDRKSSGGYGGEQRKTEGGYFDRKGGSSSDRPKKYDKKRY